jgi:hypothetical protein
VIVERIWVPSARYGLIERVAQSHGCKSTMTFDAGAAEAAGMRLVA